MTIRRLARSPRGPSPMEQTSIVSHEETNRATRSPLFPLRQPCSDRRSSPPFRSTAVRGFRARGFGRGRERSARTTRLLLPKPWAGRMNRVRRCGGQVLRDTESFRSEPLDRSSLRCIAPRRRAARLDHRKSGYAPPGPTKAATNAENPLRQTGGPRHGGDVPA